MRSGVVACCGLLVLIVSCNGAPSRTRRQLAGSGNGASPVGTNGDGNGLGSAVTVSPMAAPTAAPTPVPTTAPAVGADETQAPTPPVAGGDGVESTASPTPVTGNDGGDSTKAPTVAPTAGDLSALCALGKQDCCMLCGDSECSQWGGCDDNAVSTATTTVTTTPVPVQCSTDTHACVKAASLSATELCALTDQAVDMLSHDCCALRSFSKASNCTTPTLEPTKPDTNEPGDKDTTASPTADKDTAVFTTVQGDGYTDTTVEDTATPDSFNNDADMDDLVPTSSSTVEPSSASDTGGEGEGDVTTTVSGVAVDDTTQGQAAITTATAMITTATATTTTPYVEGSTSTPEPMPPLDDVTPSTAAPNGGDPDPNADDEPNDEPNADDDYGYPGDASVPQYFGCETDAPPCERRFGHVASMAEAVAILCANPSMASKVVKACCAFEGFSLEQNCSSANGDAVSTTRAAAAATTQWSYNDEGDIESSAGGVLEPEVEEGSGATFVVLFLVIAAVVCFVYREEIKGYVGKGGGGSYTRPEIPNQAYERIPSDESRDD
eukprot:m.169567 g.169567  ORF g.169567 m.169567 type:complete len:552 (-) comp13121_c0_seq1:203-1858(-)